MRSFTCCLQEAEAPKDETVSAEAKPAEPVAAPTTEADKGDEAVPATLQKSQEGLKKEEEVFLTTNHF